MSSQSASIAHTLGGSGGRPVASKAQPAGLRSMVAARIERRRAAPSKRGWPRDRGQRDKRELLREAIRPSRSQEGVATPGGLSPISRPEGRTLLPAPLKY